MRLNAAKTYRSPNPGTKPNTKPTSMNSRSSRASLAKFSPAPGNTATATTPAKPGDKKSVKSEKLSSSWADDALIVDRPLTGADRFDGGWDALVTDQPGTMVAVRTADCVPVLVHDVRRRVVAAIHAGWRGAVAGIVPKTLMLMQTRFGADLERLHVSIGPSAGVCCYEVDEPVLEEVRSRFAWWEAVLRDHREGKARLDLKALIRRQVQDCGIDSARVTSVNVCTICHEDLFFSYRREGRVIGTMVSAIGLSATP